MKRSFEREKKNNTTITDISVQMGLVFSEDPDFAGKHCVFFFYNSYQDCLRTVQMCLIRAGVKSKSTLAKDKCT